MMMIDCELVERQDVHIQFESPHIRIKKICLIIIELNSKNLMFSPKMLDGIEIIPISSFDPVGKNLLAFKVLGR